MEGQDHKAAAGWHHDPLRRFEYRYFNGEQWTSDVAINGHRYVDSPMEQIVPRVNPSRGSRGMAIASFITAASAVVLGWIPFVFVIAAAAAVAAIVFGILGVRSAGRQDGFGRGFAVTGLILAPVALAVCVGGFFFTRAVIREVRDFVEPGPHDLVVDQPCTLTDGLATQRGTIKNLDNHTHDYRVVVEFTSDGETTESTAVLHGVGAGESEAWLASTDVTGSSVTCEVTDVFGPTPFDIDPQS